MPRFVYTEMVFGLSVLILILLLCRISCRHFVAMETLMCYTPVSESMN